MNIAIDISPLKSGNFLHHQVRGTGFYIDNLTKALLKYHSNNTYEFFTKNEEISSEIDLIHYPYFEPFFLSLPSAFQKSSVVTVHDLIPLVFPKAFPSGIKGKLRWLLQKKRLQKADFIITDSNSSKKDIIEHANIPEEKVSVVYLAAGEEFGIQKNITILSMIKEKYQLPPVFVLYVGDATWNKNLPRLIQACTLIDATLVMVGKALSLSDFDKNNPWNKDLVIVNEFAKNNPKIIRLGFVSPEDLNALYNAATVFVMPSLYEGFGLPILEAMSCGCPVVTTKKGSLSEVAGNAALYADPESVDSIAKEIKIVIQSKDMQRKLFIEGRKQIEKFSWKKTAEETVKIYEKVS